MSKEDSITGFWQTNSGRRTDVKEKVLFRNTLDPSDFSVVLKNWSLFEKCAVYGGALLAVGSGVCGSAFIGRFLRAEFALTKQGGFLLYGTIAACSLPNLFSHYVWVATPMISSTTVCPMCLQLRQFSINCITSFAMPSAIIPLGLGTLAVGRFGGSRVQLLPYLKYIFNMATPVLKYRLPIIIPVASTFSALGIYLEHTYIAKIIDQLMQVDDPDVYQDLFVERPNWGDTVYLDAIRYIKSRFGFK